MKTVVRGTGAALVAGNAVLAVALLDDGLVLSAQWWARWAYPLLSLVPAGMVLLRAGLVPLRRTAWSIVGIGLLCSAIGDVHYSLTRFGEQAGSTASLSDALWLAPYLAFYAGVGLVVRAGTRHFHASMWLDGIAVALAFAACSALALDVLLTDSRAQFGLLLSYPLADLVFTALVVGIWAARGWEVNGFWAPLVCAGATNAVADTANLFMIATGTFGEESPVNSLWPAAALFVAVAAWRDVGDLAPTRLDGGRLLVVPVAVALLSLTVLLGDLVTPVLPLTQIVAATAVGAVVVRMTLTFKEVALLADARRAARTDELTGLANRRAFHQHLAAALDPPGHPPRAAVLMIDLDRFKTVNDTLGHHVGDRLLTLVGQRFCGRVRAADVVARLGGDEFAVLLHGADLPAARRAAVALHHQLDEPFSIESSMLQVGGSIGVAACPDHADDVEGLLRCADAGMYAAKARGGGVTVFDAVAPQPDDLARTANGTGAHRLPGNLAGSFRLRFQPRLDLRSRRFTSVEALVRWHHPQRGLLTSEEFFPSAEQTALLPRLTDVVLREALARSRACSELGRGLTVAVTVPGTILHEPAFADRVAALLAEFRLPHSSLVIQIAERGTPLAERGCREALHALRASGVRLSLDDFGSGYSPLTRLHDLPLDEIKLDPALVTDLDTDRRAAIIVTSAAELAHGLGMSVVADGVETAAVLDAVLVSGCDYGQGPRIARPLSFVELESWLDGTASRAVTGRDRP
jgi:diguanylate cyclase (GGDEF)-like protein